MAVAFYIPAYLRAFTAGQSRVDIAASPATVGDALEALWALHPGVKDRIVDEQGVVRQHVNVFVGDESIRHSGGLATRIPGDVEISVVPAVSGGR